MYALCRYNHVFSRAAALSPSLWVASGQGGPADPGVALMAEDTIIYMDYGSEEMKNHRQIQEALKHAAGAFSGPAGKYMYADRAGRTALRGKLGKADSCIYEMPSDRGRKVRKKMNVEYHKRYSPSLNRDMEFKVYGHSGHPCIYFPCQNGRFYDFENFKMVDVWAKYIDQGRVQVFTVDTIDGETWSAKDRNPHDRIARHEQWYHYVVDELVPEIFDKNAQGNGGYRAEGHHYLWMQHGSHACGQLLSSGDRICLTPTFL